jgi:ankyrin repeat protein
VNIDIFESARRDSLDKFSDALNTVPINVTTEGGRNALHVAIAYKRALHAKELIRRGIDINWQDENGETPLHYAAVHYMPEIADLLIESAAKISVFDKHGNSALWYAVFHAHGNYMIVEMLLRGGANPLTKNKYGRSPLDFARQIGDEPLIALLSK